jgi:hypothetical protein
MTGDFRQHKAVKDRIGDNFDYKHSMALYELCDGNRIQLTDCYRADKDYFKEYHPDNVENVNKETFDNKFTDKHISYTNRKRIAVNKIMMDKKFEEAKLKHVEELRRKKKKITEFNDFIRLERRHHDLNSQDVILMVNMPIIAKVNKFNDKNCGTVVNNEECIITKITSDEITYMNCKNKEQIIKVSEFQKVFYPAYCITSHCAQGCSFDFDYTIHEWNKMDDTTKYVSLSRSKKREYVNII